MVTVTIDISETDEKSVLALVKDVATSHGFARLSNAKDLLEWVLTKKSHGLKVEQKGPRTWHVTVPQ